MAGTPPEYCIRYRRTDVSNRNNHNEPVFWPLNRFAVSGNTNIPIGKITRIIYNHPHSSTKSVTWKLFGRLEFGDGTTLDSNVVSHKFSGDVYTYSNTFDTSSLTVEKWQTCTGIWQSIATPLPSTGALYYRAVPEGPVEILVYFWSAADLVDGAEPPTVTGITVEDENGHAETFGNPVQGQSSITITGQYALDPNYIYLTAKHTLLLKDSAGTTIYNATQDEDSVFVVGLINAAGSIAWTYTVLDSAGNSVSQSGTFTVLAYTPPSISALFAERYATTIDDQGDPVYTAADDGENVRFSFVAAVAAVAGANAWSLVLTYGEDGTDEASGTAVSVQTGADGATTTRTQDRSILATDLSASVGWWFKFTLTDSFTSVSMMCYIDEASAYFNVEKFGVAVGMRSRAIPGDRRFEVAEGFEAHFYGGIYGVTNYYLFGHPTGGRWITGKPLYRATIEIEITAAGTTAYAAIDENTEHVVDFQGFLLTDDGSQRPVNWNLSSSYYCTVWRYQDQASLSARASETGTIYATILYTKSTDALRSFWVYSAEDGHIILAEQVEGSVQTSYNASTEHVNVTATAGETVNFDALTGRITIGTAEGGE